MGDLTPNTREEYFLARMAGEDVTMPEPITREEEYMKGIADAINGQNDVNIPNPITKEEIYAEQIVKNLEEITLDLEEKTITENGEYTAAADNKDGFSKVTVNVPNTYTNEDEGKVVSSGALVAQSARSESITINGTYDTTMNNAVTVVIDGNANVADGTGEFKLQSALSRIDIPNGYTSLGDDSFKSCKSLASVDLPSTLISIGNSAFSKCTSLRSIICRATTPPTSGVNVFGAVPATCPIYVPAESVDAYKAASEWSNRADYIQAIPTT